MNMFNSVALKKPTRNSFDLSHDRKFSAEMGWLFPILCQETLPGDKFRVSSEAFIRLAPMLAPVMHKVNVWVHYFFVPNRLVWDEWESFITGGKDGTSAPVHPTLECNNTTKLFFGVSTLADYMGFPGIVDPVGTNVTNTIQVSALPFRAYQTVFNEYFRDQNLSDPVATSKSSGAQSNDQTFIELQLRKRAWEKDYFTSALPWAQRGGAVMLPFEVDVTYRDKTRVQNSDGTPAAPGALEASVGVTSGWNDVEDSAGGDVVIDNIESIDSGSVTINDLRRSARLQEWLEKNATGGARYVEQIWAHFGVRSSDARMQRPEYLGGGKVPVSISEVVSTFQTEAEGLPQGNMAGHGVSYGMSNSFRRRFEEHGFIIGLMSVLPVTAYQNGLSRMFTRFDKLDYAWPEFANIGEQEIKVKELWYDPTSEEAGENEEVFGYQSRYAEYKQIPSSVHGDFRTNLDFWHMGRIFTDKPVLSEEFVMSDPTTRIYAVTDDGVMHLWCHVYNKVNAIRPLPYFGTPVL